MSGTMSAMLRMACTLTTQHFRAASLFTGYAESVQKSSCTDTKCVLTYALEGDPMGAHSVLASKHVFATLWQPVLQPLQQSGTLLGMRVRQRVSLLAVTKWFGGGMTGVVAGRETYIIAQTLVATLHDGGLAMHSMSPYVGPLRSSCLS